MEGLSDELVRYLLDCSLVGLSNFSIRREGEAADVRRKIKQKRKELDLLERDLENINMERAMSWYLRTHRDELVRAITMLSPEIQESPEPRKALLQIAQTPALPANNEERESEFQETGT